MERWEIDMLEYERCLKAWEERVAALKLQETAVKKKFEVCIACRCVLSGGVGVSCVFGVC
jgi:hypothetical protein